MFWEKDKTNKSSSAQSRPFIFLPSERPLGLSHQAHILVHLVHWKKSLLIHHHSGTCPTLPNPSPNPYKPCPGLSETPTVTIPLVSSGDVPLPPGCDENQASL